MAELIKLKNGRTIDGLYNKHTYPHLYTRWAGMRYRCNCPTASNYKNYGGRGIRVCEEWNSFVAFCKWALENGYNENLTLDRIDYDGNYEPSNCRWVDWESQANKNVYCWNCGQKLDWSEV